MKIRDLMSAPARSVRADDTLAHAAQLFWDHDCGMLPVVDDDGRPIAALTDRDVCIGAWSRGGSLESLRVADTMSRGAVSVRDDDDVQRAAQRMSEHQVRRLPVVDADGKVCGVVSLNDLALAGERDARLAREAQKVLAATCRHRGPSAAGASTPTSTAGAAASTGRSSGPVTPKLVPPERAAEA